jgi:DNA-3-methyladenine glycosylase
VEAAAEYGRIARRVRTGPENSLHPRAHRPPPAVPRRLKRAEIPEATVDLARYLLGKIVVHERAGVQRAGRITETEAYLPGDPACHAFRGPTPRTRSLYLAPGHAYVYLCYGTSYLLNVSSEAAGIGAGVLLRAMEPLAGIESMRAAPGSGRGGDLARGPGRLAAALSVDRRFDGVDLVGSGPLWLGDDGHRAGRIGRSARIGLTRAADARLRFFLAGSRHLSGPSHQNA